MNRGEEIYFRFKPSIDGFKRSKDLKMIKKMGATKAKPLFQDANQIPDSIGVYQVKYLKEEQYDIIKQAIKDSYSMSLLSKKDIETIKEKIINASFQQL